MPMFTTLEDGHFAETCPITVYRDGVPYLAVVGSSSPEEDVNEEDRKEAADHVRVLESHSDMLDALKAIRADLQTFGLWRFYSEEQGGGLGGACDLIDHAIDKAEGRTTAPAP